MFTEIIKKENSTNGNYVKKAMEAILSSKDGEYVSEIFAKPGSINENGTFGNWVGLMVELDLEFTNSDLYGVIDDFEDECPFTLVISTEPNAAGRSYGEVLWSREG